MKHSNVPSRADTGLSDYVAVSRYARYNAALGRRETWAEAVARVRDMHADRFSDVRISEFPGLSSGLQESLRIAFDAVERKDVLPSMRSLQFGGDAIRVKNARIYNCSFSYCDRIEFFSEAFWLLLCGTGTGFSVQRHHVEKLPSFGAYCGHLVPYVIQDTIEGWADALRALLEAHVSGHSLDFDFSLIRPAGSALVSSGGKAPGAEPLKVALERIRGILANVSGRKLAPIEAYDILMHAAKAVLSGGIRRSATICLFSADDEAMMKAKTGDWFSTNPQRSASNNSAVLVRSKVTREQFDLLFRAQKEFGEPGFYFTESEDYGCNPCCEIGLHPRLVVTGQNIETLRRYGYLGELHEGQILSGWQMCNLTTMNGASATSAGKFFEMCAQASLIGTLQASYTEFGYLGPVSRLITENEALLGVSICGFLDNPDTLLQPVILEKGAEIVRAVNVAVARAIGIQPAARTTAVKPEGTSALLLGAGSGIHPHHSRRYFRRVQANKLDPVFQHFAQLNPTMIENSVYDSGGNTAVITFAVEGPEFGIYREDLTAVRHLDIVSMVQRYWVQAGRANETFSTGLHHNVSNTITVRTDEWDLVADYLWTNRESFTGVSLFSDFGDKTYAQAPREAVANDADFARWQTIRDQFHPVSFADLCELTDETKLKDVVACAGGACELV